MNYIDWHCDTLSMFRNEPADGDSLWSNRGSVDFERMVRAGCAAQVFRHVPFRRRSKWIRMTSRISAGCICPSEGLWLSTATASP